MAAYPTQADTWCAVLSAKAIVRIRRGFYCPAAKLVIELDGSQHFAEEHQAKDQERDAVLAGSGLRVLRFDNRQIVSETDAVLEVIEKIVKERVGVNLNPP